VRQLLAADPALAAEVRLMLALGPGVSQRVRAGRDAYSAARDQTIIHHYGADAGRPEVPGLLRQVWGDVPVRNPVFTGRTDLLAEMRTALLDGERAVVHALYGMGGVGKTQLAVEYAHRFASSYDLVWWIAAEQVELIGAQFAALADILGCPRPDGGPQELRRAVFAALRGRASWLLIFDNAEDPQYLTPWLPGRGGHVLITSRTRRWADIAAPVEVDVLPRGESVAFLTKRIPALPPADADQIAESVGDLPLALAQAAGYMADTGIPARDYAELLRTRAAELLDVGRPVTYPRSLAAVTRLAFDQLCSEDPAAAELIAICAFLAPEPVPARWFTEAAARLPAPLIMQAADPLSWRMTLARIERHALIRIDNDALQMHRLTQAVLHSQQTQEQTAITRSHAEAVLAANHPGTGQDPRSWAKWARIFPHLLAMDLVGTSSEDLRELACSAAWYLGKRGDARACRDLAGRLHRHWRDRLGADDPDTLHAAYVLAFALSELGNNREARDLVKDTLNRQRRRLGDNHLNTIRSAIALAEKFRFLGDALAARELDEGTLARCRQVLGEDHMLTLGCANNLAADLRELGELQTARALEEDTLTRRRRVSGEDHPDTLLSAIELANTLRALGETQAARDLHEDALARYRRVLGEDHPYTLRSASCLAETLRTLGETEAARGLHEDTLIRRRRVLGEDHPATLHSVSHLAATMRALEDS
jgi:tetratricopeptide (TPR) repeat protein